MASSTRKNIVAQKPLKKSIIKILTDFEVAFEDNTCVNFMIEIKNITPDGGFLY